MPAGGSARHRNGGQRVISVNTLFWKILVTRVKRKMREGKILIPLRELAAANSSNQPPRSAGARRRGPPLARGSPRHERCGGHGANRNERRPCPIHDRGDIGTV